MSEGELSRNRPEIAAKSHNILSLGEFSFDPAQPALSNAIGEPISLRSQSLLVLRMLAEEAGRVVTKERLISTIWGDTFVTDDSLVQCIADIRRAIEDRDHKLIQTMPRRGYRLNPGRATPHLPSLGLPVLAGHRAIAVLPFTSLSDDPEHLFFFRRVERRPDCALVDGTGADGLGSTITVHLWRRFHPRRKRGSGI
ncbi:MAG: winged helix-turn-helix domain-containing protein [Paracoccaceae bacterium]